jgi:hypothetical protein
VGALEGFYEVVSFAGSGSQIYFVRFPDGEIVPNEKALEMMDGLENVTPPAQ